VRPDRDRVGTLFLRRGFAYDTLQLEARWYHSFDDEDDLYKLSLNYDLGDNTKVYISGDWFDGVSSGLFGQFATRDRIVVGIRHTF
jgi:predicted porin